jgi:hypothetical protein
LIRFPVTVRLDESDLHVYERAADAGEWAIPGSFVFSGLEQNKLSGKMAQSFSTGFLGLASFGWCSLVRVAEMPESEFETLANSLAAHFVARYGAPDIATALPTAIQELNFAKDLCDQPLGTMISIKRINEDGGIRESFRLIEPGPDSQDFSLLELK